MSSGGAGASSARASDEPPDPSAAWYRTKQQLEATPARQALLQKCGGDSEKARDKEAQYRRLTVGFLQEAGQKLRLCVTRPSALQTAQAPPDAGTHLALLRARARGPTPADPHHTALPLCLSPGNPPTPSCAHADVRIRDDALGVIILTGTGKHCMLALGVLVLDVRRP